MAQALISSALLGLLLTPPPTARTTLERRHQPVAALVGGRYLPVAALGGGRLRTSAPVAAAAATAPIEVLYDGQCMVCLTNKAVLNWFDRGRERLRFVDIREPSYTGDLHGGVSFEDAMAHFHVVEGDKVVEGSEAVFAAYQRVGLGWLIGVLRLPIVRWLVDRVYGFVSQYRHQISRYLPGGRALSEAVSSVRDLNKAAQGEGCDEEEECMLDYSDDDE